jgi:hypothetical protein
MEGRRCDPARGSHPVLQGDVQTPGHRFRARGGGAERRSGGVGQGSAVVEADRVCAYRNLSSLTQVSFFRIKSLMHGAIISRYATKMYLTLYDVLNLLVLQYTGSEQSSARRRNNLHL